MERTADNRIHTTEWEDVQYKYGNRVGKYQTHELEILAQKIADKNQNTCLTAYDPQAERVADKLERGGYDCEREAETDVAAVGEEDDDDDALIAIRKRRILELQRKTAMERFGVLRHVPGADYVAEVTEASATCWVVAALIKPGHSDCEALLTVLRTVAQRHKAVKFVSLISTEAIPSFPDRHLPCVLLYHKKELKKQVTNLDEWMQKKQLNVRTVESLLSRYGVLPRNEDDDTESKSEEGH
ncbi:phosducin [Lotmaria passim]